MVSDARESELRCRIEEGSTDPDAYGLLSQLLYESGRGEEALAILTKTLDLPLTNLQRAKLLTDMGWGVYEPTGKYDQARSLAQNAIVLLAREAESPEVLLARGTAYSLVAHCSAYLDPDAGREEANRGLFLMEQALAAQDQTDDRQLRPIALSEAARLAHAFNKFDQAIEFCRSCLEYEIEELLRLDCLVTLASSLRMTGKPADAERALNEASHYMKPCLPIWPRFYYELGLLQRDMQRLGEAQNTLRRALLAVETNAAMHANLDYLEAIHLNLAEISYECGDLQGAAAAYEKLVSLAPEDGPPSHS